MTFTKNINSHRIMIINPKGGSGKSTVACNLAGYYANWGMDVSLADMDSQKSSLAWLQSRPPESAFIRGISAANKHSLSAHNNGYLILDTPAAINKDNISRIITMADTLIIPVLPSPMDIQAVSIFIYQLLLKHRITSEDMNIAVVANRVRSNTLAYRSLSQFINTLNIPFITTLRDSSVYLKTAEKGLSIFDLQTKAAHNIMEDWTPLIKWLDNIET